MAFGSKLNQAILTASDFYPELLNNPDQTTNFATKIKILLPIINVDGLYGRQAARVKMNPYLLQTERTKEYFELEVNKSFMGLQLAFKTVAVLERVNTTGLEKLKLIGNYFKQGILQKTDLLSVQDRVSEIKNQLQYAKSNVQNAPDYLAFLLNENLTEAICKPTETLEKSIIIQTMDTSLSTNRKDIQAMKQSTEASQKMLPSSKMTFSPRLTAFDSYKLYNDRLLVTNAKGYVVGAPLVWNVFDGYKSIGKMTTENKIIIKSFLISSLVYAVLMTGFGFYGGQIFSILISLLIIYSSVDLWTYWPDVAIENR
jgi:outer membrane protein TolC